MNVGIPTLTILASAAIGGLMALLGVYITNRSSLDRLKFQIDQEASQRNNNLLREKGEELYELMDKWLIAITCNGLNLSAVMQGKLTYNQYLDLLIEGNQSNQLNFGRIEMLIDVYFPTVRENYDHLIKRRDQINKIESAHKQAYKSGNTDGTQYLDSYTKAQLAMGDQGDILKQKIIECIRAI